VSKVITQGAQTAIELSYEHFPDTTKNTLDFIGKVGNGLEATVKYVDDKTGNVISAQWNELDKDTQNQIKGGGNILSVVVPIGSVRKIAGLRGAGSLGGGVGAKIFKVTKKTTKINYRSGKELNKLENKGNKSREDAWVNKENVIERKFDADSGLSRVHSNPRRPEGEWIGRTKDFQNPDGTLKSASQIKKEFALPNTPKHITPLKEVSFKGLSGKVAKNKFGQGGKQQIKILKKEVPNEWFDSTKTTKLPQ